MSENNGNGVKTYRSRKWFLTLLITTIATIGTFLPPVISTWIFGDAKPLIILTGTEWVSVISMVAAAYIGGNVWQKREELKANGSLTLSANVSAGADVGTKTSALTTAPAKPAAPTKPTATPPLSGVVVGPNENGEA